MKHLLVVDDHPAFLRALARMFRDGATLTIVASFDAARTELANGLRFDVALVNSHLLGGTAIALLEDIKRCRPGALRILMSADIERGDALALVHRDLIDTYLPKPFHFEALEKALERAQRVRSS